MPLTLQMEYRVFIENKGVIICLIFLKRKKEMTSK